MPTSARTGTTEPSDVERQLQGIRDEVEVDPLISLPERLSLTCKLAREFQNDDAYYSQVLALFEQPTECAGTAPFSGGEADDKSASQPPPLTGYRTIRYARRDGNCFYRCASFRLFELMMLDAAYADHCLAVMQPVKSSMMSFFGEYSSDFSEVVEEIIEKIKNGSVSSVADLHKTVTGIEASYLIVFFRYAVSVYLREHKDDFLPFIMGLDHETVEAYCTAEVEPVDRESDNVQLVAFAKLFNLTVTVEALDRTAAKGRVTHEINKAGADQAAGTPQHVLYLLFRPGHYDLLEVA